MPRRRSSSCPDVPHGDRWRNGAVGVKDFDPSIITLLIPLIAVELGLIVWALWDLLRPGRRVRGGSRAVWALIILFVSAIGPILYLIAGRADSPAGTDPREPLGAAGREPPPGAMPGWSPAGSIAPRTVPDPHRRRARGVRHRGSTPSALRAPTDDRGPRLGRLAFGGSWIGAVAGRPSSY